jgi:hypothetical protein
MTVCYILINDKMKITNESETNMCKVTYGEQVKNGVVEDLQAHHSSQKCSVGAGSRIVEQVLADLLDDARLRPAFTPEEKVGS